MQVRPIPAQIQTQFKDYICPKLKWLRAKNWIKFCDLMQFLSDNLGWRNRIIGVIQDCHPALSPRRWQCVVVGKMGWSRTSIGHAGKFYLIARAIPTTKAAPVFAPCGARPPSLTAALKALAAKRPHYPLGHAAAVTPERRYDLYRLLSHPINGLRFSCPQRRGSCAAAQLRRAGLCPRSNIVRGRTQNAGAFCVWRLPLAG